MVKFEIIDRIPTLLIENNNGEGPETITKEIFAFLCICRACGQLYKRKAYVRSANGAVSTIYFAIGDVRENIDEQTVAWFIKANLPVGGITEEPVDDRWVREQNKMRDDYLEAQQRKDDRRAAAIAHRYSQDFGGNDIDEDVRRLPAQRVAAASEDMYTACVADVKKMLAGRNRKFAVERPRLLRRLRIAKRADNVYDIQVSDPFNPNGYAPVHWDDDPLARIVFDQEDFGKEIMDALKGSRFNFATLDTVRSRKVYEERVASAIRGIASRHQMDDNQGDNNQGDNNQGDNNQEAQKYQQRLNDLTRADRALWETTGGRNAVNLDDETFKMRYIFLDYAKYFGATDDEILEIAKNLQAEDPALYVLYQRSINIPLLIFQMIVELTLKVDGEEDFNLAEDFIIPLVDELEASSASVKEKMSILFYRAMGLVIGYTSVLTLKCFMRAGTGIDKMLHDTHIDFNEYFSRGGISAISNAQLSDGEKLMRMEKTKEDIPGMFYWSLFIMMKNSIHNFDVHDSNGVGIDLNQRLVRTLTFLNPCNEFYYLMFWECLYAGAGLALLSLIDKGLLSAQERNRFHGFTRHTVNGTTNELPLAITSKFFDGLFLGDRQALKEYFRNLSKNKMSDWSKRWLRRIIYFIKGKERYPNEKDKVSFDPIAVAEADAIWSLKLRDRGFTGKVIYPNGRIQEIGKRVVSTFTNDTFWYPIYTRFSLIRKYRNSLCHMVMIAENGCFYKALECKCEPLTQNVILTENRVKICDCQKEKPFPSVRLADIPYIINESYPDKAVMVIAILIESERQDEEQLLLRRQYGQHVQLIYKSENFYDSDDSIVIFINTPMWEEGICHCAVWKNHVPEDSREGKKRFDYLKGFNTFLRTYLPNCLLVCPICGECYSKPLENVHYTQHLKEAVCDVCGFGFDSLEALQEHQKYHCKLPRYDAKIVLNDDPIEYKDKGDLKDTLVVYADLESAITESGQHENILAGWVAWDEEKKVHIEDTIYDMIEEWGKLRYPQIMIYFHNGKGYDFHFLVEALANLGTRVKDFEIIADSKEKISYFSVKFRNKLFMFRDTFAFVSTSLEEWVKSTRDSSAPFECFNANFPDKEKASELLKKNPFPYGAIKTKDDLKNDFSIMYEWAKAPNAVELFCGKFTAEEIEAIAKHWRQIRVIFGWKTVEDYYKDYLICDVSQLADCMEFFRQNVRSQFKVDAHQYYGTPSLTWAIWLKRIKEENIKLDTITDPEMFDIINSSIRGGQTGAMTRYYNFEEEPDTFLCDLDCNSLYPTVMINYDFPCHDWHMVDFKQMDKAKYSQMKTYLEELHANKESGFIELDMIVKDKPEFYSYVPVASKREITGCYEVQSMVEYCSDYGQDVNKLIFSGLTQVVGLHEHYCCHTKLLEWYIDHDVIEIKQIYRAVIGKEEPVFKCYVQDNLDNRKKFASDPIKKMLYKLMNNSLYGKTYEDVTKRSMFRMVRIEKLESMDKSQIHRVIQDIGLGWKLIECKADVCEINKPVYLGAAITEFSKLWMYRFFYDKIRKVFPRTEVYYTDTDALTICFKGYGINSMRDLACRLNTDEEQIIDTSNFNEQAKEGQPKLVEPRHHLRNNQAGLFKSETGEAKIVKMVALRAKTYIMVCEDGSIKMSVKGCPMGEKSKLDFETFESILKGGIPYEITFDAIRSVGHRVYSMKLDRVVLSADDRKRFIYPDHIHTAPLFSKPHQEALGVVGLPLGIEFA